MMERRKLLAALAVAGGTVTARAQVKQQAYPELVFGLVPSENSSGVTDRWGPFAEYLGQQVGSKVTLRIANDYAAVIEGQRAGNMHLGSYGPGSCARAVMTGVKITAFVIDTNRDGTKGYYSVLYVKKDSPYQKIEDLKGKPIGLVDPNSTSGYDMPLFALDKRGIVAEQFFSKVLVTGSHENAVLALQQGTVETCANWWSGPDDSNLNRMLRKGMLRRADGQLATAEDFRIVLTSDLIINPPFAYLDSLPAELKTAIRTAFLDAPVKAKAAFERLSDGKSGPWEATDNATYDDTIKLTQFVDRLRKQRG